MTPGWEVLNTFRNDDEQSMTSSVENKYTIKMDNKTLMTHNGNRIVITRCSEASKPLTENVERVCFVMKIVIVSMDTEN